MTTKVWTKADLIRATSSKLKRIQEIYRLSELLCEDLEKDARLQQQTCSGCWYMSAFAGQAFTHSNCVLCREDILNPSTAVDKVCIKCAVAHRLCKHCGSDINLNLRRRKWPESLEE